jgi:hypothetical protein|tara:strand:- start:240 stop:374 length:135 start_codon:yes stop_codon:yes gene_type:complete
MAFEAIDPNANGMPASVFIWNLVGEPSALTLGEKTAEATASTPA